MKKTVLSFRRFNYAFRLISRSVQVCAIMSLIILTSLGVPGYTWPVGGLPGSIGTDDGLTLISSCTIPTNVSVSGISTNSATISWTDSSGVGNYIVDYRVSGATNWNTFGVIGQTFTVLSVNPSTSYEIRVQHDCTSSVSGYSSSITFITLCPGPPVNIIMGAPNTLTETTAYVLWDWLLPFTDYKIRYRIATTTIWTILPVADRKIILTGLAPGTTYEFQVATACALNDSGWSALNTFTTLSFCAAPTSVSAYGISTNSATIAWIDPTGVGNYAVDYRISGTTTWNSFAVIGQTSTVLSIYPSTSYEVRVRHDCATLVSDYTSIITFTTLCPGPPVNIIMGSPNTLTTTTAYVLWDWLLPFTNYKIRYRVSTSAAWTTLPVADRKIFLTGLSPGTTYEFQVATACALNDSEWSVLNTFTTLSPRPGTNFQFPIDIGVLGYGSPYVDTKSNDPAQLFLNDYGQSSDDIFYTFTLTQASQVTVDLCNSGITDSYVYLLDHNQQLIAFNDDNGPTCSGLKSSLTTTLNAGSYYIISEGYGSYTGTITTRVQASCGGVSKQAAIPIAWNTCSGYTNTLNNGSGCYTNNLGQLSPEIYYKLSITQVSNVTISTCGSGLSDTYLHLLNSSGVEIDYNDDYGPLCVSTHASLWKKTLAAGLYYIVVEGYSTSTGNIKLSVIDSTSCNSSYARLAGTQNEEVSFEKSGSDIVLFPNPSRGKVFISIPSLSESATVTVSDVHGRVLQQVQTNVAATELDTSNLMGGIYYVTVRLRNRIVTKKLEVIK